MAYWAMAPRPAVKMIWRMSVPTVVMDDTPKMYTNMGKVMKPPPTPMMAARMPTTTPPAATIQPEMRRPPGTRSSSKVIMGGTFMACNLTDRPVAPLLPPWASPPPPERLDLMKSNRA
ncbi:hypothetical protein DSECCO2_598770 [anaerobic digester metagenome]